MAQWIRVCDQSIALCWYGLVFATSVTGPNVCSEDARRSSRYVHERLSVSGQSHVGRGSIVQWVRWFVSHCQRNKHYM